jgi:hypothetical protein
MAGIYDLGETKQRRPAFLMDGISFGEIERWGVSGKNVI